MGKELAEDNLPSQILGPRSLLQCSHLILVAAVLFRPRTASGSAFPRTN